MSLKKQYCSLMSTWVCACACVVAMAFVLDTPFWYSLAVMSRVCIVSFIIAAIVLPMSRLCHALFSMILFLALIGRIITEGTRDGVDMYVISAAVFLVVMVQGFVWLIRTASIQKEVSDLKKQLEHND